MKILNIFYNQLLPQPCILCQLPSSSGKAFALCDYCHYALPWLDHACVLCALPLADPNSQFCGQCIKTPPSFIGTKIPFRYAYPLDHIILDFKFQHKFAKAKTLSFLMMEYLEDAYQNEPLPDAIIPIPIYWKRRFLRGFNQTEMLGHDLANKLSIPLLNHICVRTSHHQTQKDSNRQSRQSNLKNAFQVPLKKRPLIEGKHLALLDDVVTTGATTREVSKLLLANGAASVVIWALARTPRVDSA